MSQIIKGLKLNPGMWWYCYCSHCDDARLVEVVLDTGESVKPIFCTNCGSKDIELTEVEHIEPGDMFVTANKIFVLNEKGAWVILKDVH